MRWLHNIRDIVLAGSAIWTVLIARKGLETWREQLRGTTEFDLARKVLLSSYKIRSAVSIIRNPWAFNLSSDETQNLSEDEIRIKERKAIYEPRFKILYEELPNFESLTLESEALWGKEIREALTALRVESLKIVRIINGFIYDSRWTPELSRKFHSIIYSYGDGDDELGPKIDSMVSVIENLMRPHIAKTERSFSIWHK
jgi:hypothetical protein